VVAYGHPELVDRCLEPVAGRIPVIVVDNSGSEGVRAVAERRSVTYIDSGRNLGFAGGVNVGLRRLGDMPGDVFLLNPDVVIDTGTIRMLSAFLHLPQNDDVAAVSPRLVDDAGREQQVAWPFPSPARAWLQALGLGRLPTSRSFVVGAALLLRREALESIGLFDGRFFLYAEEADWQWRGRQAGWRSAVCPEAEATHVGAATSDDPLRRETLFHAAQETYVRKWHGTAGWHAYRVATMLGGSVRTVVLRGERRREAARRTVLYRRGPCRAAGSHGA
jgi:GT2 family glycosyltransferase